MESPSTAGLRLRELQALEGGCEEGEGEDEMMRGEGVDEKRGKERERREVRIEKGGNGERMGTAIGST